MSNGEGAVSRRSLLEGAVYGTELVTFSPSRRGIVPLPIERLEELLFEAGYTPTGEPGLDSGAYRESSPP